MVNYRLFSRCLVVIVFAPVIEKISKDTQGHPIQYQPWILCPHDPAYASTEGPTHVYSYLSAKEAHREQGRTNGRRQAFCYNSALKGNGSCTPGRMQLVFMSRSVLPTEVLLRVLLACLVRVSSRRYSEYYRGVRTFAGLLTFWPMTFHLLASYSLIAASSAALFFFVSMRREVAGTCILRLPQIRHNAYPLWVVLSALRCASSTTSYLIPVLFHAAFGALRKCLRSHSQYLGLANMCSSQASSSPISITTRDSMSYRFILHMPLESARRK